MTFTHLQLPLPLGFGIEDVGGLVLGVAGMGLALGLLQRIVQRISNLL